MTQLAKVFDVKWHQFNVRRFIVFGVLLGLLIVVGVLPHDRRYFLSAIFGLLFVALADPGGSHGPRVAKMAVMAVAGALLTALGFSIGPGAWGWVVLAAFVATLLGGLAVKYGVHRFVAAYLLNVWFIIALGLAVDNRTALEVIIVVLFALAASIRTMSCTWYCAAVAGAVLIAADVSDPSNLTDEGRRILWMFAGVGIAIIVLLLAGLLQKRTAKTAPQPPKAPQPSPT